MPSEFNRDFSVAPRLRGANEMPVIPPNPGRQVSPGAARGARPIVRSFDAPIMRQVNRLLEMESSNATDSALVGSPETKRHPKSASNFWRADSIPRTGKAIPGKNYGQKQECKLLPHLFSPNATALGIGGADYSVAGSVSTRESDARVAHARVKRPGKNAHPKCLLLQPGGASVPACANLASARLQNSQEEKIPGQELSSAQAGTLAPPVKNFSRFSALTPSGWPV